MSLRYIGRLWLSQNTGKVSKVIINYKGNYKVIHGLSAGVGKAEIQPSGRSVNCDTWAMSTGREWL